MVKFKNRIIKGHGPRKPHNTLAMAGFIEEFLHQCLHGDVEPFSLGEQINLT